MKLVNARYWRCSSLNYNQVPKVGNGSNRVRHEAGIQETAKWPRRVVNRRPGSGPGTTASSTFKTRVAERLMSAKE